MMIKDKIPVLGVGVGYRSEMSTDIFMNRERIGFLEIIADHYIDAKEAKVKELEMLKDHFTLIPHGINLSLGSADGLNENYLAQLGELVQYIDPPYWSEHIAYTHIGGIDIGHLAPMPCTQASVDVLCRNIDRVQHTIDVPLVLENITYTVKLPGEEMREVDFINAILGRSGCGLLMDVTNLFINSRNHKYDPAQFLDELMCERIVQLHFTGSEQHGDEYLDTHANATNDEVWKVMEEVFRRAQVKGVILERDDNFPEFSEILGEISTARILGESYLQWK